MIKLEKLKELLLKGILLSNEIFKIDDIDVILDERDMDIFDSEWMRVYNVIKLKKTLITTEIDELIEKIREISYKIVYDKTKSSDLAGYISDDFGIIAEALILDVNDEWLNAMAFEYTKNRIPRNSLNPLNGKIDKIILG
jgi:hypothetical protein